MNLTAAITELKARGASYLSDARCTTMLNDAKNVLEDAWDWPWLETSTTGTSPVTISDLKQILTVTNSTDKYPLEGTTYEWLVAQVSADLTLTGDPVYWYLDGTSTLKTYPVGTDTLTIRYLKYTAELSGSDTPSIPTRYHPLWIDLAMVDVYHDSDDFQAAAALSGKCQQRLTELVQQYGSRNRQNPMTQQVLTAADW